VVTVMSIVMVRFDNYPNKTNNITDLVYMRILTTKQKSETILILYITNLKTMAKSEMEYYSEVQFHNSGLKS